MDALSFQMGIADWIIIGFLALFLIIGLTRGFVKQILSFAKGFVSIIISIFLVKPVATLLVKTPLFTFFDGKVNPMILSKYPETANIATSSITTQEELNEAFTQAGLSKIVSKIASTILKVGDLGGSENLAGAVSYAIVFVILKVIAFVLLFILILIALAITVKILESLVESSSVAKFFDKLFGLALGALKGALIVCVLFLLLGLLAKWIDGVGEFVNKQFFLLDDSVVSISKYVYQNNPLLTFFNMIF